MTSKPSLTRVSAAFRVSACWEQRLRVAQHFELDQVVAVEQFAREAQVRTASSAV
jgi:hypothetical protein